MAITFGIRPGERLNEGELARQLGVSRTPLREALNRLASEGYLTMIPSKGFFSRPLDAKEIYDLYELRSAIETAAVRLACDRATKEELESLERFVIHSRDEAQDQHAIKFVNLDEEFHERIAALSRNDAIALALRAVNGRIHFVRWIDMQNGRRSGTQREHLDIVKALRSRDADRATKVLTAHIGRRLDQIVEVIKAGFAEIYMGNQLAQDSVARSLERASAGSLRQIRKR